jgi:hypothetical protein
MNIFVNKLLYIFKGIAIAIPLALISESLATLINNIAVNLKLYYHSEFFLKVYGRSNEALDFLFFQLLYIVIYPIGFEFLRKRGKFRLIFTISCLVLYLAAIIYFGFFRDHSYYMWDSMCTEKIVEVFLFPLIAVFIRELFLGKLLAYLWSFLKKSDYNLGHFFKSGNKT